MNSIISDSEIIERFSEILETHLIACNKVNGTTTVHFISKNDKVDFAVTMPTLTEALAMALVAWYGDEI